MKRTVFIALLALGFLAPVTRRASAQDKFEGTVTMAVSIPQMDEEKHEAITNIKGDKIMTEVDLGAQGGIKAWIDVPEKKAYMYSAAMGKKGMIMDFPDDAVSNKEGADDGLKATGQKATIAGHASEEYSMKTDDGDVAFWMTSDLPKDIQQAFTHSMSMNQQKDPKLASSIKRLAAKGFVPVKTVIKMGGEIAMSSELVKIEPKKLDDKIFERPADVQFVSMAQQIGEHNESRRAERMQADSTRQAGLDNERKRLEMERYRQLEREQQHH
jgi:hypothetical protein